MRLTLLLIACLSQLFAADAPAPLQAGGVRFGWRDARWSQVVDAVGMQLEARPYVDARLCDLLANGRVTLEGTAPDWMGVATRMCAELRKQAKEGGIAVGEKEELAIRPELLMRNGAKELLIQVEIWKAK